MIYIGIDPGMSGGIASLSDNEGVLLTKMPDTEHDVWRWIHDLALLNEGSRAVIEDVGVMPGNGAVGQRNE